MTVKKIIKPNPTIKSSLVIKPLVKCFVFFVFCVPNVIVADH